MRGALIEFSLLQLFMLQLYLSIFVFYMHLLGTGAMIFLWGIASAGQSLDTPLTIWVMLRMRGLQIEFLNLCIALL